MICVFCQAFEDDTDALASWEPTFMWRLREYEGPVCAHCVYARLTPRSFTDEPDNTFFVLDDNASIPLLVLRLQPHPNRRT